MFPVKNFKGRVKNRTKINKTKKKETTTPSKKTKDFDKYFSDCTSEKTAS